MLGEIEGAEAGSLGTEDGTTPCAAFTGENACVVLACELLVHTVEVTNFAAAYAYVACRDVLVGADAVPELKHESLAETHDFIVGLAYGVEVGTALCTAHREGCEGVLEGLFKAKELEH